MSYFLNQIFQQKNAVAPACAGATDAAPLHHLISGYLLYHLKLAKAAACAFI
jgi:ABC-type enterochelin transport system permease subunit